MGRNTTTFDPGRYLNDEDRTYYVDASTDGGLTTPRTYDSAGSEHGDVLDALDEVQPGDRVLWGDRKVPCVVARVVDDLNDRVGRTLTASVIRMSESEREAIKARDGEEPFLQNGDVFVDPRTWGGLRGISFVVIQGPCGGFYAIAKARQNGRTRPALFRAVRSFHSTRLGHSGQGAWTFEEWGPDTLTVVENGDAPDELDPVGDLPAYEDVKGNRLVGYDRDEQEHYVVSETVEEAFDRGLKTAYEEAEAENSGDDEGDEETTEWDEVPPRERVEGTPNGYSHSTVTVTEIYRSEFGLKAVLDAPAPWETPDDETPFNEVIKTTPWEDVHYDFDNERKAWTVDASELSRLSSVFRDYGYSVVDEAGRK